MRRRHVLPRSYGQLRVSRRLLPDGVFRLFVARRGGRIAAAAVCYAFRDTVEIHYSASDASELPARPNHRLWWGILDWAAANGFRRVDLGEAKPGSALEDFKRQFLAVPQAEYRYDFVGTRAAPGETAPTRDGTIGRLAKHPVTGRLWGRTPLAITRLAGTLAWRYG